MLVATLICHPDNPSLSNDLVKPIGKALKSPQISWLASGIACDLTLPDGMLQEVAEKIIRDHISGLPVDLAIQPMVGRKKQALIADMDSTMIDQECIDELAAEVGLKDRVASITAKAMNGEIEFEPALRERVALLKGLPQTISGDVIKNKITLASGGKILVATMKANNVWCALVSGGFTLFTDPIAAMIGFDENHANILEVHDGHLTGTVKHPILGAEAKVAALNAIAKRKGLEPSGFIAVGDGANDLPMLKLAGTGVALHAKPSVAAQARIRIDHCDLTALLYIQGYRQDEFTLV